MPSVSTNYLESSLNGAKEDFWYLDQEQIRGEFRQKAACLTEVPGLDSLHLSELVRNETRGLHEASRRIILTAWIGEENTPKFSVDSIARHLGFSPDSAGKLIVLDAVLFQVEQGQLPLGTFVERALSDPAFLLAQQADPSSESIHFERAQEWMMLGYQALLRKRVGDFQGWKKRRLDPSHHKPGFPTPKSLRHLIRKTATPMLNGKGRMPSGGWQEVVDEVEEQTGILLSVHRAKAIYAGRKTGSSSKTSHWYSDGERKTLLAWALDPDCEITAVMTGKGLVSGIELERRFSEWREALGEGPPRLDGKVLLNYLRKSIIDDGLRAHFEKPLRVREQEAEAREERKRELHARVAEMIGEPHTPPHNGSPRHFGGKVSVTKRGLRPFTVGEDRELQRIMDEGVYQDSAGRVSWRSVALHMKKRFPALPVRRGNSYKNRSYRLTKKSEPTER